MSGSSVELITIFNEEEHSELKKKCYSIAQGC